MSSVIPVNCTLGTSAERAVSGGAIPNGQLFFETDTLDMWFRNAGAWVFVAGASSGTINGRALKARLASVANVNVASAPATMDNKSLNAGDIVLLAGQTVPSQNGLYVFAAAASPLTRAPGYDDGTEVHGGDIVAIEAGDAFAGDAFVLALDGAATVGSTSLPFRSLVLQVNLTDTTGTPGSATVNKPAGKSSVASGQTTCTVTNSLVTATSIVIITPLLIDATVAKFQAVPGAGSFVVTTNAAATANWPFSWEVKNA